MIAQRPDEVKEIFKAYIDGINRYIQEVVLPDPEHKLPYEFQVLGISSLALDERDSTAFGAFMVRQCGEIGGAELENQQLLERPHRHARRKRGLGDLQRPDMDQRPRRAGHRSRRPAPSRSSRNARRR